MTRKYIRSLASWRALPRLAGQFLAIRAYAAQHYEADSRTAPVFDRLRPIYY